MRESALRLRHNPVLPCFHLKFCVGIYHAQTSLLSSAEADLGRERVARELLLEVLHLVECWFPVDGVELLVLEGDLYIFLVDPSHNWDVGVECRRLDDDVGVDVLVLGWGWGLVLLRVPGSTISLRGEDIGASPRCSLVSLPGAWGGGLGGHACLLLFFDGGPSCSA